MSGGVVRISLPLLSTMLAGCSQGRGALPSAEDGTVEITSLDWEVLDAVATVVQVTWSTDEESTGHVEFAAEGRDVQSTSETAPGTEHEVLLLGLPPDTLFGFRVVAAAGEGEVESDEQNGITGSLPSGAPFLAAAGQGRGGFACVTVLGSQSSELLVNELGEIVWYRLDDPDTWHINSRCLLSADGQAVIYNDREDVETDDQGLIAHGTLWRAPVDGSEPTRYEGVDTLSHDFTQLPDGTLAAIIQVSRDYDGKVVYGDTIQEIDADGEMTEIWSAFDHFQPGADLVVNDDGNWLHVNAIDYDWTRDAYYLGLLEYNSIAKVDRATGDIAWIMGRENSAFEFAEGTEDWGKIHQFDVGSDRVLVFSNTRKGERDTSSAIEYAVDWDQRTLTETWRHDSDVSVYALGGVTRLDEQTVAISWSTAGLITQVRGQAEIFSLQAGVGSAFGYLSPMPSLYRD